MSSTKRLKIFQVLECGGPGGTGNQVAALCNGLDQKLFDVGLVYAARGTDPGAYRASASGASAAFHVPAMVREISPLKDLRALAALYVLFKKERPDVVHAHSSKAGFLARLAGRLAGVAKIYYSPRGYGFLQLDKPRPSRILYRFLEWCVSGIGEIIAVSPSEAALARSLARGRPVRLVCDAYLGSGYGADHASAREGALVGGCGRMTHARNMDAFVTLCQRMTDSRNGLRCVWIGGGEEEASVRRHLENMNLLGKVELTGWLARDAALERMRGLDIFAHYSRWEGLPNAVLEAMALGLPVVASDVPGNRDAVVHGETGFIARNEVELLEYCLKLHDDRALRLKMGAAGRKRVLEHFPLDRALAELQKIYLG